MYFTQPAVGITWTYHVCRSLVELTRKLSIADVELGKGVAGRKGHFGQVCNRETRKENRIIAQDSQCT